MKFLTSSFLLSLNLMIVSPIYAASGDSVMVAPSSTSTPSMSYKAATASSGNVYSYTYVTQYQTNVCPSGLTVNGSSIYNSAQRQVTYSYLGNQLVGTNTSAWKDIDTDCAGTENQTIACASGYTGSIAQERKVGTASNGDGTKQYGIWTTKSNSCSRTETQTISCPAGYTGTITQQRQITMSNDGTYNTASWVTTANNCVAVPTSETRYDGGNYVEYHYWYYTSWEQFAFLWNGVAIPLPTDGNGNVISGKTTPNLCDGSHQPFPVVAYQGYYYQPDGTCTQVGVHSANWQTFFIYKLGIKRTPIN